MSGGRDKITLQVDALEALVAAMYLDTGFEAARTFILDKVIGGELRKLSRRRADTPLPVTDYKSALQEMTHSMEMQQPAYSIVREQGPQHSKMFTVEVKIRRDGISRPFFSAQGQGGTKKKGEQAAAKEALEYLRSIPKAKPARSTSL
jgi:ribonuclease-3